MYEFSPNYERMFLNKYQATKITDFFNFHEIFIVVSSISWLQA